MEIIIKKNYVRLYLRQIREVLYCHWSQSGFAFVKGNASEKPRWNQRHM